MNEKINALASLLVENAPTLLRVAFNEEDDSKDQQPEAAHFLKFNLNGDERRMGRDLELYNFMEKIAGEPMLLTTLLQELVMPLKSYTPEAFTAGIAYLRDQSALFGDSHQEWNDLLTSVSK